MKKPTKSYYYKGFMLVHGLCGFHEKMWTVMDWRNYDETIGALGTGICEPTIEKAKKAINWRIFAEANIPF